MRKRFGIVAVTLLGMLACGDGMQIVGDAMVDAGEALLDAGQGLVDASDAMRSDAAAQVRTFEAECTGESVLRRDTNAATGDLLSENLRFYAEASAPGITPENVTSVIAVLCDREVFGVQSFTCGAGVNCESDTAEPMRCRTVAPGVDPGIEIEDGRVRVMCGSRLTSARPDPEGLLIVGERWQHVRFVIE